MNLSPIKIRCRDQVEKIDLVAVYIMQPLLEALTAAFGDVSEMDDFFLGGHWLFS